MTTITPNTVSTLVVSILLCSCPGVRAQAAYQNQSNLVIKKEASPVRLLQQSLVLTDEQAKQLEPLLKEQQARMNALRTNSSLSRQERMAVIKEMRKDADEKLKAHLTPEQIEKLQQSRQVPKEFAPPKGPKEHTNAHSPESLAKPRAERLIEQNPANPARTNHPTATPHKSIVNP